MHLSWEAQKTYLVAGRAEPRGQNKNQVWQHNPARRRLWCTNHPQGTVAPLYITFQPTQRALKWPGDLISSPSSAKKGENVTGSFTKEEKSRDFPPMTSATIAGVTLDRVSCTPLCLDLSARSDASPWTLSLVRTTQTPPPPPPPHLLSLPSSVWHLPIPDLFPIPSRVLLLLPCPPLSSSSCCSLLHSRRTRLLSYSTPLSRRLALFSSPTSAARFLTFLHFHTLQQQHMLQATAEPTHVLDTY